MSHDYDFYSYFQIKEEAEGKENILHLTAGQGRFADITDVYTRIQLLTNVFALEKKFPDQRGEANKLSPKDFARVGERDTSAGLKALIHSNGNYNDYITCQLSRLHSIGIDTKVDLNPLPQGSWILEFPITLKTPFYSSDDVPLYIIENPVRKDKVFKIPFISSTGWKGNLRWVMMKVHLESNKNNPEQFAEKRFQHLLLFGAEKGMKEDKDWKKFLDELCRDAKGKYEKIIKDKFNVKEIPSVKGMLHFYPTLWNKIDMDVINPHDRRTKTGINPIYYEIVPAGAKGTFRLLYVPLHHLYNDLEELKEIVITDLIDVIKGVREMMLTYGFSAKKTVGFGIIKDKWDKTKSRLEIKGLIPAKQYADFQELEKLIQQIKEG